MVMDERNAAQVQQAAQLDGDLARRARRSVQDHAVAWLDDVCGCFRV
jgi:hypothetical protein